MVNLWAHGMAEHSTRVACTTTSDSLQKKPLSARNSRFLVSNTSNGKHRKQHGTKWPRTFVRSCGKFNNNNLIFDSILIVSRIVTMNQKEWCAKCDSYAAYTTLVLIKRTLAEIFAQSLLRPMMPSINNHSILYRFGSQRPFHPNCSVFFISALSIVLIANYWPNSLSLVTR